MLLREFADFHGPALERDEVKYNLILGLLGRLVATPATEARLWTLGAPGACAMQTTPDNAIILGQLAAEQCYGFAEATLGLDYPGVVGVDLTARLFAERAAERGMRFVEPIPQLIHVLRRPPVYRAVPGSARPVGLADTDLFAEWLIAFFKEATPHDTPPPRHALEQTAAAGNYRILDRRRRAGRHGGYRTAHPPHRGDRRRLYAARIAPPRLWRSGDGCGR